MEIMKGGECCSASPPGSAGPSSAGQGGQRGHVRTLRAPQILARQGGTPPPGNRSPAAQAPVVQTTGWESPGILHRHRIWPTLAEGMPKVVPGDKCGCKKHCSCPSRHGWRRRMLEEQTGRCAEPQNQGLNPEFPQNGAVPGIAAQLGEGGKRQHLRRP